jgi:hypothetical protein
MPTPALVLPSLVAATPSRAGVSAGSAADGFCFRAGAGAADGSRGACVLGRYCSCGRKEEIDRDGMKANGGRARFGVGV